MIDLTPVDVRKKKGDFRRTMRGYDPAMVDDFLDLVADRLDQLVRETMALSERVGREDQQIAEYRERERALTEALVTAQEMREEIRQQTSREAEVVRQGAEQEVAALRAAVEEEIAALREAAEKEAAEVRRAAQQEAAQLRSLVERDTDELRTTVKEEREREEEVVRQLRLRQQQLMGIYRTMLERELAALTAVAEELGLPAAESGGADVDAAAIGTGAAGGLIGGIAATAAAVGQAVAPESDGPTGEHAAPRGPDLPPESAPAVHEAEPVGLGVDALHEESAEDELFGTTAQSSADVDVAEDRDEVDDMGGSTSAPLMSLPMFPEDEDTGSDLGVVEGFELFEPEPLEPFAPEPFDPIDAADLADAATPPDAADALELYEGVAEDVSSDGVPGPIGLSSSGSASADSTWKLEAEWSIADLELTEEAADADPELAILGEEAAFDGEEAAFDDEDADEDAARLLRNAEEAGYRLDGDDEDELLLLEDAILEEQPGRQAADEQDDTDEWLGTFLEDK